jgi:hypothetical protein
LESDARVETFVVPLSKKLLQRLLYPVEVNLTLSLAFLEALLLVMLSLLAVHIDLMKGNLSKHLAQNFNVLVIHFFEKFVYASS